MDNLDFYQILDSLVSHSWLNHHCFDCSSDIIEESICNFFLDYARWYPNDSCIDFQKLKYTPQLMAVLFYRISRNLYLRDLELSIDQSIKDSFSLLARHIGQIELYYSAAIDEGLKINHGFGSVIGARCRIGRNFTIHQNCTIGDKNGGRPIIGNNVTMYAGSMILGDVTIGDNSIIGANSVVIKSCPPDSILVGTPAKIITK